MAKAGQPLLASVARLVRTTAFKLMAIYLLAFLAFAAVLLGAFAWRTHEVVARQTIQTISLEVQSLMDQYRSGGPMRLATAVEARARQPGAGLFLLASFTGEPVVGNISRLPREVVRTAGWHEAAYATDEEGGGRGRAILNVVTLPGGFRLVVGQDVRERETLGGIVRDAVLWSAVLVVALGVIGGLFVSRRVMRRVDAMAATTDSIIRGDLAQRLPVTPAKDEFDRLASQTNAMLDRIGELMAGIREVSDNIAHDLRTPLTRLRSRAEGALAETSSPEQARAALEAVIAESDGLIRTFDALLTIARAEADRGAVPRAVFDVGDLARAVAELYEPTAEERGFALTVMAMPGLAVAGERELLAQALSNLVENALAHGRPETDDTQATIAVSARAEGARVLLTVADRGPGIPEAERARVTERFVRLDAARSRPGTGLGLALVRAVARSHGGDLVLGDHGPGRGPGLVATLDLPRATPQAAGEVKPPAERPQPLPAAPAGATSAP